MTSARATDQWGSVFSLVSAYGNNSHKRTAPLTDTLTRELTIYLTHVTGGRLMPERTRRSHARPTSGDLSSKKWQIGEKSRVVRGGRVILKVVILGASGVGKTCIMRRYLHPQFDITKVVPTLGLGIYFKAVSHKGIPIIIQMEDTAGQERYRSLVPLYLRDANAILLVFDTSERQSFTEDVPYYLRLVASMFDVREVSMVLVGNKVDKARRQVDQSEAFAFAQGYGMRYIETSVKTGHNIEQLFEMVVEMVYNRLDLGDIQDYIHRSTSSSGINLTEEPERRNQCSCLAPFDAIAAVWRRTRGPSDPPGTDQSLIKTG